MTRLTRAPRPWLRSISFTFLGVGLCSGSPLAQDLDGMPARGEALFNSEVGCWVCHGQTGEGLVGASLLFGPTPVDVFDQLESNPVMGVVVSEMNPSDEDLVAISMYIRTLAGLPLEQGMSQQWLGALQLAKANQAQSGEFAMTPRDLQVEAVESFASLQANWIRRSKEGGLLSHYESKEIATFDPGEPKQPRRRTIEDADERPERGE